jgi:hypothetical protein
VGEGEEMELLRNGITGTGYGATSNLIQYFEDSILAKNVQLLSVQICFSLTFSHLG